MSRKNNAEVLANRQRVNLQLKKERQAQARRRMWFQGGIIAAVVALVAVVAVVLNTAVRDAQTVHLPEASAKIAIGAARDVPLEVGDGVVRVGFSDAPVTLSVFEDFSCPHCQAYEAEVGDTMVELMETGDLAVEFHPVRIVTPFGNSAGSASTCVAVHEPERWLDVHAALFAVHDQASDGWSGAQLSDFVGEHGVSDSAALECVASGRYANWINQNTDAAREAGITATPTILINGEAAELGSAEQLRATVEQLAIAAP